MDFAKRRNGRSTERNAEEFETIKDRFKALYQHNELFSFLYDFENYKPNRINGTLQKPRKELEVASMHDWKSDIDGDDLIIELSLVSTLLQTDESTHATDIFNSIEERKLENLVPKEWLISLHISLTIPVSVASNESDQQLLLVLYFESSY